jgi:UrcA family protein
MFRTVTAAALIAISLNAAQAGEVRFGDLNLASPRDAEVLKSRIAAAAAQTCGPVQLDFGVSASIAYQAARDQKACIARISERTLTKVQAMVAKASTTHLARQ